MLCNSIKIALDLKLNDFVTIYRANLKGFRCAGARNQLLSHSSVPNLTENAFREGPFKFPREDASTAALDFYAISRLERTRHSATSAPEEIL